MTTNKKIYLSLAFLLAGVLMLSNVFAFAVSSMYWEENPLTINPGQTQEGFIVLQNMAGTETVNAKVNILQGSEIATMNEPGKIYEIPVGQKVEVYFTVNVPEDSEIGGNYNLIFDVSTVSSSEEGPMSFGSGMQKLLPVLVTQEPKEKVSPLVYYIVAGIILLGIIALVIVRSNRKN
ncbi:MAG: hypothetical protein ACP5NZ_03595 [Nanobdellota archaeon]